jgi:hypothetical protein
MLAIVAKTGQHTIFQFSKRGRDSRRAVRIKMPASLRIGHCYMQLYPSAVVCI